MNDSFLNLVQNERDRQQSEEGYSTEHDDKHVDGSIADAAACYAATTPIFKLRLDDKMSKIPMVNVYPFAFEYFKNDTKTRKQQLIVSAALLYAEYQRLARAELCEPLK